MLATCSRRRAVLGASGFLALLCAAPVTTQNAQWVSADRPGQIRPPGRWAWEAFEHDAARNEFVLFGGWNYFNPELGDTWTFDGATWIQHNVIGPTARSGHAMAFDPVRREIVLFGGLTGANQWLNDTWVWNGSAWSLKAPTNSPSPRHKCALVADTARDRLVLFGGWNASTPVLDETWEWDGSNWVPIVTVAKPPARSEMAMAYDSARQRVVMFGGGGIVFRNDTWEYDGTNWTEVRTATAPPVRTNIRMVYVPSLSGIVLFGGMAPSCAEYGDVWLYDGVNWTELGASGGPSARNGVGMALDPTSGRVLVIQGATHTCIPYVYSDESWWLSPRFASYAAYRQSCPSSAGTPQLDAVSPPAVGQQFQLQATGLGSNRAGVLLFGFQDQLWGLNPLPLELTAIGAPGCYVNIDPAVPFPVPTNGLGIATAVYPLTNSFALIGAEFFNQYVSLDDAPPGRALTITTTNAGHGVVGL